MLACGYEHCCGLLTPQSVGDADTGTKNNETNVRCFGIGSHPIVYQVPANVTISRLWVGNTINCGQIDGSETLICW
jgi:hypothetical protein